LFAFFLIPSANAPFFLFTFVEIEYCLIAADAGAKKLLLLEQQKRQKHTLLLLLITTGK
jgi:hypothetical protein